MLPGTKTEVDDISSILDNGGFNVQQVMEDQATETAVKNVNQPGIVHIATHGYFQKDVGDYPSVFGVQAENAQNNPLLRSGLLLADMGKVLYSDQVDISSDDNGILTAYEVLNLDLEGTDLVVLSACETGLGEIKSGEGVYGLQRAFQVAGTDAIIMSLWKVSDDATQKLMSNFYRNWVGSKDKQTAFRDAQLQLMEEYKEPYYWGAFVMIGG
jgi:CHAT domain-containing protein